MKSAKQTEQDSTADLGGDFTADELKEGRELQAEYDRLFVNHSSMAGTFLIEQKRKARLLFFADPSDSNLAALKAAIFSSEFWSRHTEVRSAARVALRTFVDNRVKPWAQRIIERYLARARAFLKEVSAKEDARHRKLLGRPMRNSEIVNAAAQPVNRLEEIAQQVSSSSRGIISPSWFIKALADDPREALGPLEALDDDEGIFQNADASTSSEVV